MSWWDKIVEAIKKWFKKQKPEPDPQPDPDPDPAKWENKHSEGYRIRLKTYTPPHKNRRFSAKIDTRFFSELGMTSGNTRLTVDGVDLEFYGWDRENGKHDMCFADKKRYHKDLPRPVYLRIFKDGELHTVVKIPEWRYGAIYVPKFVAWDDNTKKPDSTALSKNPYCPPNPAGTRNEEFYFNWKEADKLFKASFPATLTSKYKVGRGWTIKVNGTIDGWFRSKDSSTGKPAFNFDGPADRFGDDPVTVVLHKPTGEAFAWFKIPKARRTLGRLPNMASPDIPVPGPAPTGNVPPFYWGMDESKWSKEQSRGYNFGYCRYLDPKKEKWKGEIMCPSKEEATNMRYRMRGHIEHDKELEGGYKGRVFCGYAKSGMLSIRVHDAPEGKLSWWVQP